MEKPANNKLPLLIIAVLVVLTVGGTLVYKLLNPRKKQFPDKGQGTAPTTAPPVTGRENVSSQYTTDELIHTALTGSTKDKQQTSTIKPQYQAVWMGSNEGKRLIEERMRRIQLNVDDANFVRAKHKVGRTLVDTKTFTAKALNAIGNMFSKIKNVKKGDYLTYPVYGKYEAEGAELRSQLQHFLSKSWDGYNVTERRHGGTAWYISAVGLNLIYGDQSSYVHTADQIWWAKLGDNGRAGLDFYKALNGHDVDDHRLLEKKNGKGVFNAGVLYQLVGKWLKELDYFDSVTRLEAIDALEREGKLLKLKPK